MISKHELQEVCKISGIDTSDEVEKWYRHALWELKFPNYRIHRDDEFWCNALNRHGLFYVEDDSVRPRIRYFVPTRGLSQVVQFELSRLKREREEAVDSAQAVTGFTSDDSADAAYQAAQTMVNGQLETLYASLPPPTQSWRTGDDEAAHTTWGTQDYESVDQERYAASQVGPGQLQSPRGYEPLQSRNDQEASETESQEAEEDWITVPDHPSTPHRRQDWDPPTPEPWEPQFTEHKEPDFTSGTWLLSEVEERLTAAAESVRADDDSQERQYLDELRRGVYHGEPRPGRSSAPI
ncbi:MAG: hypothetical protein Q9182_007287 [Xanthomendoza sp. 2 TL-2023]